MAKSVCSVSSSKDISHDDDSEMEVNQNDNSDDKQHDILWSQNCDVLANLDGKLGHLSENMQYELKQLLHEREDIFPDVPSRTNAACHDVDVGDKEAIKCTLTE